MAKENVSIRKVSKEQKSLPKGAKVLSKEISTRVEEIENGYIICKDVEYRYEMKEGEGSNWLSISKKWFSAEDPLQITVNSKDKSLADVFNDD